MLVGAGQEKGLVAQKFVETGEDVGEDRRVGVPNMGRVIDIINRSGDVKIFHGRKDRIFDWGMIISLPPNSLNYI